MHERGGRRAGTRLLGLLVVFVLSPTLAPWLPGLGCPHHDGTATGHPSHHSAPHAGGGTHGDGEGTHGHGDGAAGAPSSDHHSGPRTAPPPCDCLGKCPTSAGPIYPSAHQAEPVAQSSVATAPRRDPASRIAPSRAPYLLPFPNGPPPS